MLDDKAADDIVRADQFVAAAQNEPPDRFAAEDELGVLVVGRQVKGVELGGHVVSHRVVVGGEEERMQAG
ncbi:hypothetical protein ATETN484_0013043400 [Aspergillus terreus]|nr:hypothetical protein ATETN484_0013043400 [Aspergillus terreus]